MSQYPAWGPFTTPEILGALVTCLLLALTYFRSGPEVRRERTAYVAASCAVLVLLLSMRFQLLPSIEDDMEVKSLGESSTEAKGLFDILATAPDAAKQPLMDYILRLRLDSVGQYFDAISQGKVIVDGPDVPQFSIEMIKSAKSTIDATSYAGASNWWDQPWGVTYEAANEEAIKRKVLVTRTFLFTNKDEFTADAPLLTKEFENRIKVRYAYVGDLHGNIVNGYVVIDGQLAGELHLTPTRGVKDAVFYTQPQDVANVQEIIARVVSQSSEVKSPIVEKGGPK